MSDKECFEEKIRESRGLTMEQKERVFAKSANKKAMGMWLVMFLDDTIVDIDMLLAAKIIRKPMDGLKVLGNGELTKKITVKAAVFSSTAKEKIEAAGGKTEVV